MDKSTEIITNDTKISSRDETIEALFFFQNKKVKFLPIEVDRKFPNLVIYGASECSLSSISNFNFENLSKLKLLSLFGNQIQIIRSDTFIDLKSLEKLYLNGNKLQFINGGTFATLNNLKFVDLSSNQCINEKFETLSQISLLESTVNGKCSFDEITDFKDFDNFGGAGRSSNECKAQVAIKDEEIEILKKELLRKGEEIFKMDKKIKKLTEKLKIWGEKCKMFY